MASIFDFVEKEGKYFAPIANRVDNYVVQNGAVVQDGQKIVAGTKGVYATVRFRNSSEDKAELFAVNTEFFQSSQ